MKEKPKRLKLGDLPMGIHVASFILDLFAVLVSLPIIYMGIWFVAAVVDQVVKRNETNGGEMVLSVMLVIMVGLYVMVAAAIWLAKYLRAIHFRGPPSRAPRVPDQCLRTHAEPVIYGVACVSLFSLVCGVRSWAWNLTWAASIGTCGFLIYLLNRNRSD